MHLTLPVAGSSIALVITAMRARRAAGGGALVMPSDGVIASLEDAQAQLARAREVVAARKEADHVRVAKTREMAYVTLFYVPAGRDWRVDFGGRAWKDPGRDYRKFGPRALMVLNWWSLKPSLVGGGVSRRHGDATPEDALNREMREELGDGAERISVTRDNYCFTIVSKDGADFAHHYCVVLRDEEAYTVMAKQFFQPRPALLHELVGVVDVPLTIEAPDDVAKVNWWGRNVIGLPRFFAGSITGSVRDALLLHMLTVAVDAGNGIEPARRMMDEQLLQRVSDLAACIPGQQEARLDELLRRKGVAGLIAARGW